MGPIGSIDYNIPIMDISVKHMLVPRRTRLRTGLGAVCVLRSFSYPTPSSGYGNRLAGLMFGSTWARKAASLIA